MTRSRRWLSCLPIGLCLVGPSATGEEPTSDAVQRLAIAEYVTAREETASERPFDPSFRAKTLEKLGALPMATLLQAQAQEHAGLGLNSLGDSQADLVYTPLTPCRIIDTRLAGGAIAAGTARTFLVTGADYSAQGGSATGCGVPYGPTSAAVVNFVAVNPTGAGNFSLSPFGSPMPLSSIINFRAGVNLANGLVVATCNPSTATCDSDITIKANASAADLVADVQGYFQRVTTGGVGTALLADAAVTAPKIAPGVAVRSLNGLTEEVTLAAGGNISIAPSGNTLTISASGGSGGSGDITAVNTPAGGGLQGGVAYGDANLALLGCSTGRVLKSSGTAWACATDADNGVTTVTSGGGVTGSIAGRTLALGSTATPENTPGAIVARDASGGFSVGTVELAGALRLPDTLSASEGVLTVGGTPLLHAFGAQNVFLGADAGNFTLAAVGNSGVGYQTLKATTSGHWNNAFGYQALFSNTSGESNSAFGVLTLYDNKTGSVNSAFGPEALASNTEGSFNSAFGGNALVSNTTGGVNSAFGFEALLQLSSGDNNIGVGAEAGYFLTDGSNNIYIGSQGVSTTPSESGTIRIGDDYYHTATYIAGISGKTSAGGTAVYIDSHGKLGTITSSRRYKEQVADMGAESDVLMKLRPVTFYYRPELDEAHLRQYGLVAEEVAEVAPGLVAYGEDGSPQTVRYNFVNALLLNEVQRLRRYVQDLETRLIRLESGQKEQ
jgi:hypothetical protein